MNLRRLVDAIRGEQCPGAVPVHPIDETLEGFPPLGLAGTQKMQSGLPATTQIAWKALAARFPKIRGLGAWGDRSHMARKSCHNSGKAIDAMTVIVAEHEAIVAWALANRAKYGITLIISQRKKWSAASGWKARPYLGASPHNDHVHLSIGCVG